MTSRIPSLVFAASLMITGVARSEAQQLSDAGGASKYGQWVNALFDPVTDQLNLTPEQQARIEEVASAEYAKSETPLRRLGEVTAALDEEQLKENFDEDRVRALAAQGGQAMTELAVIKLRMKSKVFALLTPAQKSLVEQQLRLNRERGEAIQLY
jgi:Spy/CpxP family protein refolding chaperone